MTGAEAEVRFGGREGALTLLLKPGPTGALVSNEARIECGPLDGRVSAVLDVDLDQLRDQVERVLEEPTLTGEVFITGSEHGTFSARLRLDHGRGTLAISLESEFGDQPGGGTLTLTTDHTFMADALRNMSRLSA